uniref:DNA polymerase III subunit epsilon n=1 Tax=Herbaspirillum seropedicae TaxID=964 RepID=UPI0031DBE392
MRQIILDTETTGLSPRNGNRILEIGCVEVLNRQLSGKNLHFYINPERDSEEGALAVHGLTTEFLADKPTFKQIAAEFLDYVRGAQIIIHNAPFDVGFLDAELALLGLPPFKDHVIDVVDSLQMAKELHPGRRNSLDALCDRYGISNAHRVLHGALLDAELLAEVYLSMTRGQNSLTMDLGAEEDVSQGEGNLVL